VAECQYGTTLGAIRADHVGRYEWADARVRGRVLDIACGCGYGAAMLARPDRYIVAVDRNAEAIAYAREHWSRANVRFTQSDVFDVREDRCDWAVCFETLEHLEEDVRFLQKLRRMAARLLISVPNENVIPKTPDRYRYHVRHYTPDQFTAVLAAGGWSVTERWRQPDTSTRAPVPGPDGHTTIAVCAAS
jgi:SAM-dependent methyltransferase